MEVKVCPNCNYQNISTVCECKECRQNLKSIENFDAKNAKHFFLSFVTGCIAGLVGGLVRTFFFDNIGIDLYCVYMPLLAPL